MPGVISKPSQLFAHIRTPTRLLTEQVQIIQAPPRKQRIILNNRLQEIINRMNLINAHERRTSNKTRSTIPRELQVSQRPLMHSMRLIEQDLERCCLVVAEREVGQVVFVVEIDVESGLKLGRGVVVLAGVLEGGVGQAGGHGVQAEPQPGPGGRQALEPDVVLVQAGVVGRGGVAAGR